MSDAPNVGYTRPELEEKLDQYQTIRDCMEGEYAIKKFPRCRKYLPDPDPFLEDDERKNAIYGRYLMRPPWYGVARRTRDALVGEVFKRAAIIKLPAGLEYLKDDVDGDGLTLEQQMTTCLKECVDIGRGGLFVDYTTTAKDGEDEGTVTKADVEAGNVRTTIVRYKAEDIVNWRKMRIGSKTVTSQVVLQETFVASDDGYEQKLGEQRRELLLEPYEGGLFVNCLIWRKLKDQKTGEEKWTLFQEFKLIDHAGKAFDEIPFEIFGSEDNNWTIDPCPMMPITALNLAHFRVSADVYASAFKAGNAQLVTQGLFLDKDKGERLQIGPNTALMLPSKDADAKYISAPPDTLNMALLEKITEQLTSLAAKIIREGLIRKTATQVKIDESAETSTLTTYANNVSRAYTKAFKHAARYTGDDASVIVCKLNTQFDFTEADSQRLLAYVTAKDSGVLTLEEVRDRLIEEGVATKPYNEFVEDMKKPENMPAETTTTNAAGGGAAQTAAMSATGA